MNNQTDFGYESVSYQDKQERVSAIFSKVAPYYDKMNDFLSLGLHRYWKNKFIESVKVAAGDIVLDLACGSGDIFLKLASKTEPSKIYAVDPNKEMLFVAQMRTAKLQLYKKKPQIEINFLCAFGENLTLIPDNSISVLTLSFGFRNVADRMQCLREIYRVLKPEGHFYLLEFAKVQPPFDQAYNFYRDHCLPVIGKFLFNDTSSYQYLADSIAVFWDQDKCIRALQEVGFVDIVSQNYTNGIVCCYQGKADKSSL